MRLATLLPLALAALPLAAAVPAAPPECVASSKAFTGAAFDAPFFVFDGSGQRGPGIGQFDAPSGIAAVGAGLLVIADTGNHRLKLVTQEGFFQDFWGGGGSEPGLFQRPGGIAPAERGFIWAVDTGNHRVQKLAVFGEKVSDLTGISHASIGGHGSAPGLLDRPTDVAVDAAQRVWVVDAGNRRVQQLSPSGEPLRAVGGFTDPWGIAIAPSGAIYVTDRGRHRVVQLDAEGTVVAEWGRHGSGPGELDGPHGIAVDPDGFVYVADTGNARVQKLTAAGEPVAVVGCRGARAGQFVEPVAVAIDAERHLYVADSGGHRVQKLGHQ